MTAEHWPTSRPDVAALFGKYLPRHGLTVDLVAGRDRVSPPRQWGGGRQLLCDLHGGAARKHLMIVFHTVRCLFGAKRGRYTAIQVRDKPIMAAIGLLVARIKGLPFYYWMSYPVPEGEIALAGQRRLSMGLMKFLFPWISGHLGRLLYYGLVVRYADHIFVQSKRMKLDMQERGVSADRLTAVPMGVDLEEIPSAHEEPQKNPSVLGRKVIVYLGTLDRPRRIEVLFDVLRMVKRTEPNVLLILVGDTHDRPHQEWLRQRAIEAGVYDDILWTGWLPQDQAWAYLRVADVAVSPVPRGKLLDCSSPTKLCEYLAFGVPVVCNDSPDQQEIINATKAGYCVPYTADDFSKAICAVLQLDASARCAMAQRGRLYVERERSYKVLSAIVMQEYQRLSCQVR